MESEQQFSLSWNNFHGNVSRELSALLGSGALADVTLAAGGQLLHAHRLVLAICSPYFKRMFQINPAQHPIVVLRDVTHEAMRDLLQFMYHGEVSVRREDLTSFIATAELLQIKGLTNKETDDDQQQQEQPKQTSTETGGISNPSTTQSEMAEPAHNEEHCIEMKRNLLNERIQRLNQLKRKSEEFLQTNFNFHTEPHEKIPKFVEKPVHSNHSARLDSKPYSEQLSDGASYVHQINARQEYSSPSKTDVSSDVSVKAECDDSDIIVMDPAMPDLTKSFESASDQPLHDALPAVTDDPQHPPARYRYIYSRKGHKQLVHASFVYTKHSTSHGKTSWRCVQYFSLNRCPATVETVRHALYSVNHRHNHDDFREKLAHNTVYESTDEG